jgi:exonuclease III
LELPQIGERRAVRGLLNIQKEEDPDILFLSETKMTGSRMEGFRWKLGLTNMVAKDCLETHGGGVAMFWRRGIDLHVRGISRLYIDADVTEED